MKQFDFTLKFAFPDVDADAESCLDRLYEAGCDDALIGIGKSGVIALDFTREADNACEAMISAIKQVEQAIPDARLIEASPDMVGLTDIAVIIGCTRQYMRKLREENNRTFPQPLHENKSAIWHLLTVLDWLQKDRCKPVDESLLEVAAVAMRLNLEKGFSDSGNLAQTEKTGLAECFNQDRQQLFG